MKMRRELRSPKIFVIEDIHGREWTTKEGLKYLYGVYAVELKKYFYEVKSYERKSIAAPGDT